MTRRATLFAAFFLVLLLACKKRSVVGPTPKPKSTSAPLPPPAPEQLPIRDNSTDSAMKFGASVRVRLFVSTLTRDDPLRFGFQLVPETPITKDHPWLSEQVDLTDVEASLVFEIKTPNGKIQALK